VTASAGGIGKTSLATVEGLAIATGRDLLGENVRRPSNVWIINLEDPLEEMQLRLSAAMQHYGISYGDISGKLFMDAEDTMRMVMAAEGRDGLIQNDALLDFMVGRVRELGIGVVIIDPFVSTHLVNENSNASIQAVVAMFRKLARDTGAAVHLIHHVRKGNGDDATVDSVRGAGSLIGAARSARVINKITEDDALRLGVEEAEARGIFRVDDGKANLAPPAEKAVYRRMIGVQLPNEEWVGVAVDFKLPDPFENITKKMTLDIQNIVAKAEADGEPFRASVQAKQWVGHAIAPVLKLDTDNKAHKAKLSAIVKIWISNDVLRVENITSKRDGRDVPCVIVGEWITSGVDN
jgi:RecA-family ATPase